MKLTSTIFKFIVATFNFIIISACSSSFERDYAPYLKQPFSPKSRILIISSIDDSITVLNGFHITKYNLPGMHLERHAIQEISQVLKNNSTQITAIHWNNQDHDLFSFFKFSCLNDKVTMQLENLARGKKVDYILVVTGSATVSSGALVNSATPINYHMKIYLLDAHDLSAVMTFFENDSAEKNYSMAENVQLCKHYASASKKYQLQNILPSLVAQSAKRAALEVEDRPVLTGVKIIHSWSELLF